MSEVAEPDLKRVKLAGDEEGQGTAETSKEAEKVGSDLQFSYLSLMPCLDLSVLPRYWS